MKLQDIKLSGEKRKKQIAIYDIIHSTKLKIYAYIIYICVHSDTVLDSKGTMTGLERPGLLRVSGATARSLESTLQ